MPDIYAVIIIAHEAIEAVKDTPANTIERNRALTALEAALKLELRDTEDTMRRALWRRLA